MVRFCVREDAGGEVRIDYVLQRAHLPYQHGGLVYDRGLNSWTGLQAGSLLQRQAQAYLESYLLWKDGDRAGSRSLAAGGKS